MNWRNFNNRLGLLAFSAAAIMMAGCSADELATEGGGSVAPPSGQTAASGTVNFTNNTSMTIGNGLDGLTRAAWLTRGATFDKADNKACSLDMPEQLLTEEEINKLDADHIEDGSKSFSSLETITGKPFVIDAGGRLTLASHNMEIDVYVLSGGYLNLRQYQEAFRGNGKGRIFVLDGATVNIEKNVTVFSSIEIYAYKGSTVIFNDTEPSTGITEGSEIYLDGDVKMNGRLAVSDGSRLYIGGSLTGKGLDSDGEGTIAHVMGNLTAEPTLTASGDNEGETGEVTVTDGGDLCVEGVTDVYSLTASTGACVHTDCKLVANDALNSSINITNGATLCSSYVETKLLHISGGTQGALTRVLLPDQGVINVDKLSLGNTMLLGLYNQGNALVSAKTVTVENRVKWEDIVDPALYVNYDEIWADAEPADKSMINKVTMGAGGECSPGFTENEPEDPDPGTDPDDPEPEPEPTTGGEIEIPIKIDDIINEDYILKADDFAIRVNGEYMDDIKIEGDNSAKLDGVKIVNDALTIIINGLVDNPAIIEGNDYTYECWIWVENKSLLNDGTGGYGPLFDYDMYEDWANPEGDPDTEDPYGYDMTKRISESGKVKSPAGFVVRYNVYRGLAGRMDADGHGDTPYIKVSVSVQKDPDARENTNVGIWPAAYNN